MKPEFFEKMTRFYTGLDSRLLSVEGNVCKECQCSECCSFAAKGGNHSVSQMELDYIEHYYRETGYPQGSVELFQEYLARKRNEKNEVVHTICPFFDHAEHACSIYPARPVSCRIYGSFLIEGFPIPSRCYFKNIGKRVRSDTVLREIPMALDFYELKTEHMGTAPMTLSKQGSQPLMMWDMAEIPGFQDENDPFILACKLEREGKYEEAISAYGRARKRYPNWSFIPCCVGIDLMRLNRVPEAIQAYREALSISPDNSFYHFTLAFALKTKGEPDAALSEYVETVKLNPENAIAHTCAANLFTNRGELTRGLEHYEKAIGLDPECAWYRFYFGELLSKLNRLADAETQLQKAVDLEPQFAQAYHSLARVLSGQNKSGLAAEAMQKYSALSGTGAASSATGDSRSKA